MQISERLNTRIVRAVQVSMRTEGYPPPTQSKRVNDAARKLMERWRVQVSLPGK